MFTLDLQGCNTLLLMWWHTVHHVSDPCDRPPRWALGISSCQSEVWPYDQGCCFNWEEDTQPVLWPDRPVRALSDCNRYVVCSIYSCICADTSQPVLHPHHKLSYFHHAGWTNDWIATVKKLVQDEYDCSYCFWADIVVTATGPKDESEPLNNIFDSLLAFCKPSSSATASNKLKCYITKGAEDMKNEDILMWWHKHKLCTRWPLTIKQFHVSQF